MSSMRKAKIIEGNATGKAEDAKLKPPNELERATVGEAFLSSQLSDEGTGALW
jgi:hypothetical protein